jgi:hypothetical protein
MGEIIYPRVFPIDLSVARDGVQMDISGDYVGVFDATDAVAQLNVAFEIRANPGIIFRKGRRARLSVSFTRLFLTNAAQAGKTLDLIIGGPESFDFEDVGAISVQSITDPIFTNVLKGVETFNGQVSVGASSTALRVVPANTIEYIELENVSGLDAFISFGITAVITDLRLAVGQVKSYVVAGGAAGFAVRAISTGTGAVISVLAVPVK